VKNICKGAVLAALAGGIMLATGGVAAADSNATGYAIGSPGLLSGNVVQIPIDIPINACGNSVSLIGILNPSFGNTCVNVSSREDGRNDDSRAHREGGRNSEAQAGGQQYGQSAGRM
jgi:hypothetical protein